MYNKEQYKEILEYFKDNLELTLREIKSLLFSNENALNEELDEFLSSKSKRLRPLLVFMVYNAICKPDKNMPPNKNIIKLAAALELLHSATLLHDDIIDEADTRRTRETLNNKYGAKIATLGGDYLLSLSLKLLSEINSPEIFKYFSENTLNICKGEINQFFNKNNTVTIEEYIEKSKNKTSSLFIAGVKSALYLINKEIKPVLKSTKEAFLGYTLNFSLGFQIFDDIENFLNKNIEKSGSDIENGIYTLPYLYLLQQNQIYDIIEPTNQMRQEAEKFSVEYLNNILDNAAKSLDSAENIDSKLLIKLTGIFKIQE